LSRLTVTQARSHKIVRCAVRLATGGPVEFSSPLVGDWLVLWTVLSGTVSELASGTVARAMFVYKVLTIRKAHIPTSQRISTSYNLSPSVDLFLFDDRLCRWQHDLPLHLSCCDRAPRTHALPYQRLVSGSNQHPASPDNDLFPFTHN
jgi:hypothetical protein